MKPKNNKKEMTINELAQMLSEGFKNSDKKNDKKIEDLATLVQNEILDLKSSINRIDSNIDRIDANIDRIDASIDEIKSDTQEIKTNLHKKTDVFEHKNLEFRVEKLENKTA